MADTGGNMEKGLDWALGALDARVGALERRMEGSQREINAKLASMRDQNEKLNNKLDALREEIIASRSGWKAIVWFVGIAATASTVLSALHQLGVIR